MSILDRGQHDSLYYELDAPSGSGQTFVFVNALTGSTGMWQEQIGPGLRKAGHGTLAYNFRGQDQSSFEPGTALTPDLIVEDLTALLARLTPQKPILVGTAWDVWVNLFSVFQRPPIETWSLLTIAFWNTTLTQLFWLWGLANVPDITRGSFLFFPEAGHYRPAGADDPLTTDHLGAGACDHRRLFVGVCRTGLAALRRPVRRHRLAAWAGVPGVPVTLPLMPFPCSSMRVRQERCACNGVF